MRSNIWISESCGSADRATPTTQKGNCEPHELYLFFVFLKNESIMSTSILFTWITIEATYVRYKLTPHGKEFKRVWAIDDNLSLSSLLWRPTRRPALFEGEGSQKWGTVIPVYSWHKLSKRAQNLLPVYSWHTLWKRAQNTKTAKASTLCVYLECQFKASVQNSAVRLLSGSDGACQSARSDGAQ